MGMRSWVSMAAALWVLCGPARAEPPCRALAGHGACTACGEFRVVGPELSAPCRADLGELGLAPEKLRSLEERRVELRKQVVRVMAELRVQQMELSKLLAQRRFDLTAAQKKVGEISVKEAEIRTLHVEFLHRVGASLGDGQWREVRGGLGGSGDRPEAGPARR